MEGKKSCGVTISQAGGGQREQERKGGQDVVALLGWEWGQGCQRRGRFVWIKGCPVGFGAVKGEGGTMNSRTSNASGKKNVLAWPRVLRVTCGKV